MYKPVAQSFLLSTFLFGSISVYAAQPVDLGKQPISVLKSYMAAPSNTRSLVNSPDQLKETSRNVDRNQTTHIRVQQTHNGYLVWGADAVVHMPAAVGKRSLRDTALHPQTAPGSNMNGVIYQQLSTDLQTAPAIVFEKAQADKAMSTVMELAKKKYGSAGNIEPRQNKLMVYVDKDNKAHYAFFVSIYMDNTTKHQIPAKPVYILDAATLNVYTTWNEVKTVKLALEKAQAGGLGGNVKLKKPLVYDGLTGNLAALNILRDAVKQTCYMQNQEVTIFDARHRGKPMLFSCRRPDPKHANVYWNGSMDSANGGYLPANDSLYAGTVVQDMYQSWIGVPMLVQENGKPMLLRMYTHYGVGWDNAEWDEDKSEIHLGDGGDKSMDEQGMEESHFYPLTSLGVVAHEVSHGYTQQHSNLVYEHQSGGMNESFSDMAAQAAESFASGHNSWQIGPEISKDDDIPLRYMDQPSKDCVHPGYQCSIDTANDYYDDLNVHYTSGVYNRMFYLLATSDGWTVRKAFEIMAQANANYWTATSTYEQGACGVMKATKDLHYDTAAVAAAFKKVGLNTKAC